jgi:hypothetical protein
MIHGVPEGWWLEIIDDRDPVEGRPYYLDPFGDLEFWIGFRHITLPKVNMHLGPTIDQEGAYFGVLFLCGVSVSLKRKRQ